MASKEFSIVAFVYPEYETLDLHGPIEILGNMGNSKITILAQQPETCSRQGPKLVSTICDPNLEKTYECDCFLIPGSITLDYILANNKRLLEWLKEQEKVSRIMFSVCTGSGIFAGAGLLDGMKATTNKQAFCHISELFPNVDWQGRARWVHTGKYLTSSGVSAGTDAALYLVKEERGIEKALSVATGAEYVWNQDPDNDPFAVDCCKIK